MKRQPTIIATNAINIDRPYPARATNAAPGKDTIPYDMKNANCVNIDCVYVRLKIARTDGISGSIMAVMKPHAKKSVVTAMNAARKLFPDLEEPSTCYPPETFIKAERVGRSL